MENELLNFMEYSFYEYFIIIAFYDYGLFITLWDPITWFYLIVGVSKRHFPSSDSVNKSDTKAESRTAKTTLWCVENRRFHAIIALAKMFVVPTTSAAHI